MTVATPRTQWSLRHELTRVLVLAALLPAMVFGVALLWSQWQRDHDDLLLRLGLNAQLSANALDDFLQGQLSGIELLADGVAPSGDAAERALERLLRAYPAMARARVASRDGFVIAMREPAGQPTLFHAERVGDRDWFSVALATGRPYISDGYRERTDGEQALVAVSAPLRRGERLEGVLQASIPVETFVRVRSDNLRRRGFELLLIDRQDRVIHASEGLRWRFLEDTGALGAAIRRGAARSGLIPKTQVVEGVFRDGDDAFVSAVRMRAGWVVALIAPEQRLMAPTLPRLGLMLGLLAATLAGVAMALWRMRRLLSASMGRLLASLHGYALGGRLDPSQLSRMPEELQPLAQGIGDLGARMNTAFMDLRQALDEREHVITERTASLRQAVADLDRLSRTDALTGSLNYRGFLEATETLWTKARSSDKPLSVLALDIDHFKRYNDMYGHAEGDGALRRFAGAVRSALLHADDVLARPGGEEFIVFLPGSSLDQAIQVGERVCQRVRDADIAHAASPEGRMTVSIGVASIQPDDVEAESMLRRADAALYRAKAEGRNRVGT